MMRLGAGHPSRMARLGSSSPSDSGADAQSPRNRGKISRTCWDFYVAIQQALRRKSSPFLSGPFPFLEIGATYIEEVCAHRGPEMVENRESPRAATVASPGTGLRR